MHSTSVPSFSSIEQVPTAIGRLAFTLDKHHFGPNESTLTIIGFQCHLRGFSTARLNLKGQRTLLVHWRPFAKGLACLPLVFCAHEVEKREKVEARCGSRVTADVLDLLSRVLRIDGPYFYRSLRGP